MPPLPSNVIFLLLWLLGAACLVWVCFPPLAHISGVSGFSNRIDSPPAAARLGDTDRYSHNVHQQLERLGFIYLGSLTETHWLVGASWRRITCFRVYASAQHGCFACLFRLAKGEPVRLAFTTVFAHDALVWTANANEARVEESDYVRQSVSSNDLTVVLRQHAEVVSQFRREGHEPMAVDELAPLVAAAEHFSRADHRRTRGCCHEWLVRGFHLLIAVPVVVAYFARYPEWMVPLAFLAGAVWYGRARRAASREIGQLRRLEVLQQDEPTPDKALSDAKPDAPSENAAITTRPRDDQYEARP